MLALVSVLAAGACGGAPVPPRAATEALVNAAIEGVVPDPSAGTTSRSSAASGGSSPQGPVPELAASDPDGPAKASTTGAGPAITAGAPDADVGTPADPARSPLADLVRPIGTARYDPAEHVAPARPVTISIPDLGVDRAPIDPVGVKDEGELDVPDPLVVGWYTGSPVPGASGASVLAAHVNYDGVPGVFRHLRDLRAGELVEIGYEDGTTRAFVIAAVELYDKDELPEERVWAKDGDPTLVLFTCGGRYNRAQRSYEDNVVAFAEPLG